MEDQDKLDALILRPDGDGDGCGGRTGPDRDEGCAPPRCREEVSPGYVRGCPPPRCREDEAAASCPPPDCPGADRLRRGGSGARLCAQPYGTSASSGFGPPPCLGRLTGERPCCCPRWLRGRR